MSKAQLLSIANINFFPNTKPQVTFLVGKNPDGTFEKVQADFSGWDKEKGIDLKAINKKSASNVEYIRVAITLGDGAEREYYNGALFSNKKKVVGSNQPDLTGTLDLTRDRNGPKLILAAWNKTGATNGTPFISLAMSEPKEGQAPAVAAAAAANDSEIPAHVSNSIPMDDDVPF